MFSLEYIMECVHNYKSICNELIGMAPNLETKEKLESVLYTGAIGDYQCQTSLSNVDYPHIEAHRRLTMAYLLLRNPETFSFFVNNNITIFHGSNANSLPSILKYGLKSHLESEKEGIDVTTGEQWSRMYRKRNFISFTDVLDTSQSYASLGSTNGNNKMSFGVVYGTTTDSVKERKTTVYSDVPEIAIKTEFPLELIRVICVPSEKVSYVKKIVPDGITVLPMDDMDLKFYYMDNGVIVFPAKEKLQEYLDSKKARRFATHELSAVASNISIEKIKMWFGKLENVLFGGEEYERTRVK